MSKRVLAPILLLIAATGSLAAVFAVQRIETGLGPVSEPYATRYIHPEAGVVAPPGVEVRFTTTSPERVTVRVLRGTRTVATIVRDRRVEGRTRIPWGGLDDEERPLPDGTYRVVITRAGDQREYEPAVRTVIDTVAPTGEVNAVNVVDGQLRGLVFTSRDALLRLVPDEGSRTPPSAPLAGLKTRHPEPGSRAADPAGAPPPGTVPLRFVLASGRASFGSSLLAVAYDRAGNETTVGVIEIAADGRSARIGSEHLE